MGRREDSHKAFPPDPPPSGDLTKHVWLSVRVPFLPLSHHSLPLSSEPGLQGFFASGVAGWWLWVGVRRGDLGGVLGLPNPAGVCRPQWAHTTAPHLPTSPRSLAGFAATDCHVYSVR